MLYMRANTEVSENAITRPSNSGLTYLNKSMIKLWVGPPVSAQQ